VRNQLGYGRRKRRHHFSKREDELSENRDLNYETDHFEGETYSSHIGLLSMPAVETTLETIHYLYRDTELPSLANNFDHDNNSTALVFFDLKTTGVKTDLRSFTDCYEMWEHNVQ